MQYFWTHRDHRKRCLHTKRRCHGENSSNSRSFRRSIKKKLLRSHTAWPVSTSSTIGPVSTDDSLSEDLGSKKRYTEAGQVLLDYAEDVREAVVILVEGNQFSEARRIVS